MKVSVCIPVHNGERTLEQTLQTITGQSFRDLEILVVDNASTDSTPDIVQRFAATDPRVRHLRYEELVPVNANITRCMHVGQGEYTAIFHADDLYHPEIVAEEVALLDRRPDIGAVITCGGRVDAEGRRLAPFPVPPEIFRNGLAEFDFPAALRATLQYAHIWLTPSGMYRASVNRQLQEWPTTKFGIAADLYVYLTIARNHKIAILQRELMDWRASDASMTFRASKLRRTRHDMFKSLGYFLEQDSNLLTPKDRANYDFLVLKDDINLAISALLQSEPQPARALMPRLLSPRLVAAAFRYIRHVKILAAGYVTWLLAWLPLPGLQQRVMARLRAG